MRIQGASGAVGVEGCFRVDGDLVEGRGTGAGQRTTGGRADQGDGQRRDVCGYRRCVGRDFAELAQRCDRRIDRVRADLIGLLRAARCVTDEVLGDRRAERSRSARCSACYGARGRNDVGADRIDADDEA